MQLIIIEGKKEGREKGSAAALPVPALRVVAVSA